MPDKAKNTDKPLGLSPADYRAIFDAANDAIFTYDPATRAVVDVNRRASEMFGYSAEEARQLGVEELSAGYPPYTQADARHWVRQAAAGQPVLFEWLAKNKSGSLFWVEVNLKRATIGGQDRLLAIVRDIGERKAAEAERERLISQLEGERARFEAVLQQMPAGVLIVEAPSGKVVLYNQQAERILHRSVPLGVELAQRALINAYHADGTPYRQGELPLQRALRTGEVVTDEDVPVVFSHGERGTLRISAAPIRDREGRIAAVVTVFHDTTEWSESRMRIESLAREAERRANELATIIESIADAVFVCDAQGNIVLLNSAARELMGQDVGGRLRTLADYLRKLQVSYPDGRPVPLEELAITRALRGEVVHGLAERGTHRGQQRTFDILVSAVPLRDQAGAVVGAVEVLRDVTELAELDRLKDQFISVSAHELKTPVAIMKGYAQALLRTSEAVAPQRRKMLDAINRGADRIDRIVNDLLDVSRLQSGSLGLTMERIDLPELVEEVADRLALVAPKHRLRLVHADPVVVQADRDRLEQVLVNLIDNAIRYSPKGGDLDLAVRVQGEEAVVSVKDCGVGIPADKQARIFERFYRAHTGTPYDYGGMGVGLYISKEIVARHGGKMWFESEEGKGSTFYFSLPLRGDGGG